MLLKAKTRTVQNKTALEPASVAQTDSANTLQSVAETEFENGFSQVCMLAHEPT